MRNETFVKYVRSTMIAMVASALLCLSVQAQQKADATLEDALWKCLKKTIPTVERSIGDHTRAYDPESGRNFAWDSENKAWIDTKTLECICPKCPPPSVTTPPAPPSEKEKIKEEKWKEKWKEKGE